MRSTIESPAMAHKFDHDRTTTNRHTAERILMYSMKRIITVALLLTTSQAALASLINDGDVTPDVIFGTGNANGSFTLDRSSGIELGMRGKLRHDASGSPQNTFNSNGDGSYSFDTGVAPTQSFPTAEWSFEWSINTDYTGETGRNLGDLTYALRLDQDPSQGTDWISFDVINAANPGAGNRVQWDHAIGDNSTSNGGGTSISNSADDASGYADLISNNNVGQNSWKPHWFLPGFDPTVDGTYDFSLSAFDSSGELARTDMQIIAGAGGAAEVPAPGTLSLLGLGLAALAFARRRSMR